MNEQTVTDIIKIIKKNCALDDDVTFDSKFFELSIDSLSFISVIVEIEECFGIDCGDGLVMSEYETVGDLIKFSEGKINEKNEG